VVIDDLNVVGVVADPAEADPPLVVDTDAVLTETIRGKLLQMIRRRHSEVSQTGRGIEHQQFTKGDSVKIRRHSPDPFASEQSLGVGVAKAPNHGP